MFKAMFISPMIPSFHLKETGDFFKNVLNFTAVMDTPEYSIYKKDNLTIHLLPAGKQIGQMEFYLEVDNVDILWESIQNKVAGIKVREPFDRDYGMRELHIAIPQTNTLLFIGQQINK